MTIYQHAIEMLKASDTLTLSIIDEKGYPKIYPMEKVLSVDLHKVIFITKKHSNKVNSLSLSNKCCVEVHSAEDMICLSGKIAVEENEDKMKQTLPIDYIKRLENSGINKYCMLIFHTINAHLYIDDKTENIHIK